MASRVVPVAVSGPTSSWREVGRVISRFLSDKYKLDLQNHPDRANARKVGSEECAFGITMATYVDWANRRIVGFENDQFKNPEFRVIAAVERPSWLAAGVVRSAGISSLIELGEKKHPWRPLTLAGSIGLGWYIDRLMEAHGFSRDDVVSWGGGFPKVYAFANPHTPPEPDGAPSNPRQAADRDVIDGFFHHIFWTSEWARQITTVLDTKFLSFEESAVDKVVRQYGGEKMILPGHIFPGADEDIVTTGWRQLYVYGTNRTDPDLVVAIIEALERGSSRILENSQGLFYSGSIVPSLEPGLQLHAAAEEYYHSRGYGHA